MEQSKLLRIVGIISSLVGIVLILFGNIKGVRTDKWLYTLKDGKFPRLYDIKNDPLCKIDVVSKNKVISSRFMEDVKKFFSVKFKDEKMDEFTRNMLKSLGYLQSN